MTTYGWKCKKGRKVVHTNRRTFDDWELAKRAARNHARSHKECRKKNGHSQEVVELE